LSVYPTVSDKSRIVEILEVKAETPTIKTFRFHDEACGKASAGQFVMTWIPDVDEVPMSLSAIGIKGVSAITVRHVGEATEALHRLGRGDVFGIRGPYGRGFTETKGDALIVGGGMGMAPLMPLARRLTKAKAKLTCIIGAKTREELLFLDRLKGLSGVEVLAVTDDGSYGLKGLATDLVEKVLEERKFGVVYTCGPERMMFKVYRLAERHGLEVQTSLERIMRCSVGLCGSCVIGEFRVCRDGPVFTNKQLRQVEEEFGKTKHNHTGTKIKV
jgi:dihydroorotate dehydrogenase electron transfer subunit